VIVRSLRAIDLLRYERLELVDLPEQGLIVVSGPNESGKSSVGEILCLALFGRTFALAKGSIEKAIRWDSRGGTLELCFTTRSGEHRLSRELDLEGGRSASLHLADGGEVRGWTAVTEAVEALLGFGFDEHLESFYLARREATPPRPRGETLRAMAGVLPLERLSVELEERLPRQTARAKELAGEIGEADASLARYRRDDLLPPQPGPARGDAELVAQAADRRTALVEVSGQLERRQPALEAATRALIREVGGGSASGLGETADSMDEALDSIEESIAWLGYDDVEPGTERLSHMLERIQQGMQAYEGLQEAVRARRGELSGLLGEAGGDRPDTTLDDEAYSIDHGRQVGRKARKRFGALAASAAVLAVAGVAIGLIPDLGLPQPASICAIVSGGLLAVVAAMLFVRQRKVIGELAWLGQLDADLSRRRDEAEADTELLDRFDGLSMDDAVASLGGLVTGGLTDALAGFRDGPGGRLANADVGERLGAGAEDQLTLLRSHLGALTQRIEADVETLGQIHELRGLRSDLASTHADVADQLETWELARDLLAGASSQITFAFNGRVRQGLARILPSLTEGRYQYLRIDDDLTVRVFSSEKQDFVTYEEISGGTQRQIALATRIALSETLVDRLERGPQFLFLDEPFAFFDAQRTRSTLAALPRLSGSLPQIWIAAQEPPEGVEPEVALVCSLAQRRLSSQG
jgi:DNA repair exonuclease SbcCD ATPase subunit